MLSLTPLSAFNDNYIWLVLNPQNNDCAVVDPGDAAPVQEWLRAHPQYQLTDILITHHHPDHTGGVQQLKQQTGARVIGPEQEKIPARDLAVSDNQQIKLLGTHITALHTPGHTLGHIVYVYNGESPFLLSGDTLFAAGCGRLFEGTAKQMYQALQRLLLLPEHTQIYCAHEYTLSNLRFASEVEPDNAAIRQRLTEVARLREQNSITLPSNLGLEKATNPFLRCDSPQVIQSLIQQDSSFDLTQPDQVFAALRAWKDRF